jgi:hypothetical protein
MEETKKLDLNSELNPESFMKDILQIEVDKTPKTNEQKVTNAIADAIAPNEEPERPLSAEEENAFEIFGLKEKEESKPAKKEEASEAPEKKSKFREIYDLNVEQGIWLPLENEDEVEWDEDTYKQVVKLQSEKMSISDEDKETLELVKSIRDKEWAGQQIANQNTLEELDVTSDINVAINVLGHLMVDVEKMDKDRYEKYINRLTDEEIIQEAENAKSKLIDISKETMRLQAEKDKEEQSRIEVERKALEKQTKEELKKYKLTDVEVGRAVKAIYTIDNKTNLADIDKKYLELRNNPEQAAFLYQMFYNRDNMMRNIEGKAKTALRLEEASTLNKQDSERKQARPQLRLI